MQGNVEFEDPYISFINCFNVSKHVCLGIHIIIPNCHVFHICSIYLIGFILKP